MGRLINDLTKSEKDSIRTKLETSVNKYLNKVK